MKKKGNISKLEDHLGYWMRCLSNFVHESFAKRIENYDVSVEQWVVLRILFDNEGVTLQEAAALIGVDNSSLSRMIERLVKKDMVVRTIYPKNRRTIFLTLSSKAKKLLPILAQEADKNDNEFFSSLDSFSKIDLLNLLKEILIQNGWDQKARGKDVMK